VNARTWISLVNLVAIVVAFAVLFELPQYAGYAFYGLLGWILISFLLLYAFRVGRTSPATGAQLGTASPAGAAAGPGGTALPSTGGSGAQTSVDFCIYCGTTLPIAAAVCPTCGHSVRPV